MSKKTKEPKQSLWRVLRNNFVIFGKVCKYAPDLVILAFLEEGVLQGIHNSIYAVFTLHLFNSLDLGEPFGKIAMIIGLMSLWYLVFNILDRSWHRVIKPNLHHKLNQGIHTELFRKTREIDVACYDDPEFYNDFVWAMDEASSRAIKILEDLTRMVARLMALITILGTLVAAELDTVIIIICFAVGVVNCIVNHFGNKTYYAQEKERKPLSRKQSYINRVYHLPDYAKEIRISRADDLLIREADENSEKKVKVAKKYGIRYFFIYGIFYNVLMEAVSLGITFYMFLRLLDGAMLVGVFAASTSLIWRVRWNISDFIERLAKFPEHSLFLEKYYGFLSYKPKVVSGKNEVPEFKSLELKNVSFTYDFSDKPKYQWHKADHKKPKGEGGNADALRGVDLKIEKGEKIAIVGYNGAGKTTLIKLLMRLYDPTSGEVLYNGMSAKDYDISAYRAKIGCVFQDFKIFSSTIAENVMAGDYDDVADAENVSSSLEAAGFTDKLNSLEKGTQTMLTREFDKKGTNLSGGESQKVAIARVFARPYELWIMDEPSSALDPVAEYELNQSILKYAEGKTVIFISHRLSTTRMADRIYMFDSGKLCEVGSHDELMAMNGKYAEMFNLQAEKYVCG
ncbi:MAG: ABC transporter ATP-binding protein [Clostridia bacterium]|nr:ABC transporter ATP-binding protein [Clostridia bacterium]